MYWTGTCSFGGKGLALHCFYLGQGCTKWWGGSAEAEQVRSREHDPALLVCQEWDKCWAENSCSFEPVGHVVPVWCMEFCALGIEKRCIFLWPFHIVRKSREIFRQWLQNYHCCSGSADLVRSWTGAVWTSSCYSDRINSFVIIVRVHTSFLEYNPFIEYWEEEWSLWWFYSSCQWVMSASHMWKPDQTLKSPILWWNLL